MTIHAHKIARKQAEMDKMIKDLNPLNDLIYMSGYDDLSNEDRKEFAKQNSKIRKLSKKINRMANDHYGVSLYLN